MQLPVAVIAECCTRVCLGLALTARSGCQDRVFLQHGSSVCVPQPSCDCLLLRVHPSLPCGVSPRGVPACRFFYQGKLLDGAGINAVSKGAPFHSKLAFGPMVVWDCQEGRERGGGASGVGSLQNPAEAELAATLVAGESSHASGSRPGSNNPHGDQMPEGVQHICVSHPNAHMLGVHGSQLL